MDDAGAVLGIDVGCSATRRSSAACLLAWDARAADWQVARFRAIEPERTEAIVALAGSAPLAAAAIDGPLAPGFAEIGRYRAAERLLTRRLWRTVGKPGQSSTPVGRLLNAHANACARIVRDRLAIAPAAHAEAIDGRAIVEAFPSALLGLLIETPERLGARRANRSDLFFVHLAEGGGLARLQAALLPGRVFAAPPATLADHDERAAFACALTALCLAAGRYTAAGDATDGWIILPPWSLIDPAAAGHLLANHAEDETGAIFSHG